MLYTIYNMNRLPTTGSTQKEKSSSQQSIRVTADTIPVEKNLRSLTTIFAYQ
jgi:hypothetical protein